MIFNIKKLETRNYIAEKKLTVIHNPEFQWGELYVPDKILNPEKTKSGLRVLCCGSTYPGFLILEALKRFESKYPGKLNIVGFVTDDATNPQAKISVKKRIWRLYSKQEKEFLVNIIKDNAISFGIPCYTGAVKTLFFREWLQQIQPELILVCGLGQLIDKPIFEFPKYGIYNFHPSDLRKNFGTGAKPYFDTMEKGATISLLTIHHVSGEIDKGNILGVSPPINILSKDGNYPDDIRKLHDKMTSPSGWMALDIINAVLQNKERNINGILKSLDFESGFPNLIKRKLLEPIDTQSAKRFEIDESLYHL